MLEQTSEAAQYYWTHQLMASGGLGVAGFLGGLLVGAVLWAGKKKRGLQLEAKNQELRQEIQDLTGGDGTAVTAKQA